MTDEDICKGEATIMEWAAEHTEPQYPTWAEWLDEMGLTRRNVTAARRILGTDPIPADIAERLGLKPNGGNEND